MSLPDIAGHELQDLVGSGRCGAVYRAVSGNGKACAVKVFSSMAINRKALATAFRALQQMPHHRGVLPVDNFSFDKTPYFCVMPLVGVMTKDNHGRRQWQTPTLESVCTGLPPEQAWRHIYEVADALAWLHKHGIPHGNLRPSNVLLEDDAESSIRLTDIAQGWVGGIHHLELTDHFVHLCPEQAENPDGVFAGYGPTWDVYSFGVLAYRLLNGTLPRGADMWESELQRARQQHAAGLAAQIDSNALLSAVKAQPKVFWPQVAQSKWEERRRNIIERALDLNPAARWADMREVVREFEVLESDYLLEESREQTVRERQKQAKKVLTLQTTAIALLTIFVLCFVYAFVTLRRAQKAEDTIENLGANHKIEIDARENRIATLTGERDVARGAKAVADQNLQNSQNAVDQFLTQLLQTPTGNEMEAGFQKEQLTDALDYVMRGLPALEQSQTLGVERLRAYGNIGQLHLKLRDSTQAVSYLTKARDQAAELINKGEGEAAQIALYQQWLGRYSLLLSDIRGHEGRHAESLALLKDATENLDKGLAADPKNRLARNECARAWLEYGLRTLRNGDTAVSEQALARVPEILDPKLIGHELINDEKFILARAKFAKGISQREAGKTEEALNTLIDSVKDMGELVLGSSPRNQDQALLLAEAYTELAELIGRHFSGADAKEAHNQAVPILLELNRLMPEWAEVKYLLARNYGSLASLARDAGSPSEASKKKQDAIELVNEILADDKDNARYGFLLAKLRGEYAELLADSGKTTAAIPIAQQAVESMESLIKMLPQSDKLTPERRMWSSQLAQLYGALGHTSEGAGKKTEAKAAFTSAVAIWEQLAGAIANDEAIQSGLTWSKGRLAKLK
ncbi:MAG: protein kinase [Prosthecobacter sp.]|jgi:tetratricopeptide (TPR) repeat protein|uniref:protein kinase domain-containing protein n=1 Tax=Prosthecobacter sp. TaxID=1965333 RepID=UPI0019E4F61A|nr:protein kinase [Prosthecobacter sp.]MBE2287524.1 protein kinase [Prosthecobacter sp.]